MTRTSRIKAQSATAPTNARTAGANSSIALGKLPGYVGYNLRRAQSASFRHLGRTAADLGLTPGEFSLLDFLDANPGVSQTAVSQVFGVDKSTLSPVLESLAGRHLIVRDRAAHDRRFYALRLSDTGRALLARMTAKVQAQEDVIASALEPGERDLLLSMLQRIAARLDGSD